MIIWIMMALDILSLIFVSLAQFKIVYSTMLLMYAGGYLILKFAVFRDVMSGIDAVFGVYTIIVAIFHVSSFLYYLMLGWFAYKLVFTLAG